MVAQFVTDLHRSLSRDRLEAYRPRPHGTDLEMLTNYFWNIDLAEALVPCLHAAELALRNTVHGTLSAHYGTDMWFYERGVLEPGQLIQFANALAKVFKKPQPHAGRIVAELTFGFWTAVLSAPYDQRVWAPNKYALFRAAFPHAVGFSRNQVATRFAEIKHLRKRIAHYEAVWYRQNLSREHAEIHQAIQWINPTLGQAILAVDTFAAVFNGRAQVEVDLKTHLGIP